MTIKQTILAALEPILSNTWAVELPERPTWPAAVFDIDSEQEKSWVQGGGYDQHIVNVVILGRDLDQVETIKGQMRTAMEALSGYMDTESEGDADYEEDPEVYSYFMNFRIRSRR